jgi:glycosyltransferase involved in cell wall biosynthesis
MGDGEQNEGQVWEAVLYAAKEKLGNLICFIDRNYIQIDGNTEDVLPLDPLDKKYEAFNWHVQTINGHDIKEIFEAVENAKKVLEYIENSKYKNDIEVLGKVSQEKKMELMQKSHIIGVTSIKEGWGLIVTEANSQGTPACVYDADGLRDSTKNGITGLVSENGNPSKLAENMVKLLEDKNLYNTLQKNAWQWSKEITFDKCYKDFCKIVFEK